MGRGASSDIKVNFYCEGAFRNEPQSKIHRTDFPISNCELLIEKLKMG